MSLLNYTWERMLNKCTNKEKLQNELVKINAQNCYDYFINTMNDIKNADNTIDLGGENHLSTILPFNLAWFEWNDKGYEQGVILEKHILSGENYAADILIEHQNYVCSILENEGRTNRQIFNRIFKNNKKVKYLMTGQSYIREMNTQETFAPQIFAYVCDEKGFKDPSWHFVVDLLTLIPDTLYLGPILTTISFMNCKNVILNDNKEVLRRQQKREKQRKNIPDFTFKTLEIIPISKKTTHQNKNIITIKNALHICRGHFKDYREGKGLFGKVNGLYWFDQQVRGNEINGKVIKDYNIKL